MAWKKKAEISVKFIPNLMDPGGRILKAFPFNRTWTVRKYLKKSKFNLQGMRVIVNGNEVKNLSRRLNTGDEILICPEVQFAAIGIWLGASAASAFWVGLGAVVSVLSAVYTVVSALTMRPSTPSFGTIGEGIDQGSSTYTWDGVRTTADVGRPIPIIYGTHLTGGNIINEYVSTDGDQNYLNTLVAIGEGELESITLARINKNPSENYSNFTLETRLGTNDQAIIKHFEDLHNLVAIGGTSGKLEKDAPYVHTTQITDCEAFELHLQMPAGLWQQDTQGNMLAWSVTYRVEYKIHADPNYTDLGTFTINGLSRTALDKVFRKEGLTAGQYDIRVTRTSDDSDFQHSGDLVINYVDEINTDDLIYPNMALAGIRTLAIEQLSNTNPNYEFLVKGKKVMVPQVMNGESEVAWDDYYWDPDENAYRLLSDDTILTWDGTTYVTRYSANPIWCCMDLLTNTRYGLGHYVVLGDADLDFMLEMSQYCEEKIPDGLGGYEKRYRMDVVIDSPQKALGLIIQLSTIFRGMPFQSDKGKIRIAIDKPDLPVQLFCMGNIAKNSFSETWGSRQDIPNVVEVQFANQDKNYELDSIEVDDDESLNAGNPRNSKSVRYYGTKLSYAIRHGRNIIKAAKLSQSFKFQSGLGAVVRRVDEVIDIAHDVPQYGFSGTVKSGTTTTKVKLDRTVTIEVAKTYMILVDIKEGKMEERYVTDQPGDYTEVTVDEAFSETPQDNAKYSFGEVGKYVKKARIMALRRNKNGNLDIEAAEYNENAYDDSTVVIPQENYSALSADIPDVRSMSLTERITQLQDGTVEDIIDVWFQKPDMRSYLVNRYARGRIYLSSDSGASWQFKGETLTGHFAIQGGLKDGQSYRVAVVSASGNGANAISASPQSDITIVGDTRLPADVATFLVNQSRDRLFMGWSEVADARVLDYEIRYGESWDSGQIIATKRGNNHIELNFKVGADQSFFIKSKTRSGRYSQTATEAVITIESIPFTNIVQSFSEQTAWSGTKTDVEIVGDNLELSSGELTGNYVTPVRDVGYLATFKIGIEAVVTAPNSRKWDDDANAKWNDSLTERWSGSEVSGAGGFEIKISDDNVTWSEWLPWQAGDYTCRYFQIRLTLTRASVGITLQCSGLNYYADLPDVDDKFDGEVTTAADGEDVVFTKTFHEIPYGVAVTILTGDAIYHKITSLDTTGCNIKLYDAGGTVKTGTYKVHVHGI